MAELSPEEQYFLQMMFPHLVQANSPIGPQSQSPAATPHRGQTSPLFWSSSPLDVRKASSTDPPDWGPPIAEDYLDPMSPPQPRSPRRHRSPQQSGYSLDYTADQNISDYYRSQPTEAFPWNIRERPELRFDHEELSLLQKFDRGVRAELSRKRRAYNASVPGVRRASEGTDEPHTRSMTLTTQADNLAKAEALALFAEAVEAAEKAATRVSPAASAEREATRAYEARLVEAVSGAGAAGSTPVEVVAYIGVTHPKNPRPQRH